MNIKNALAPNGKPDNARIVAATQQVLDAINSVDLSHLNPTQLYIVMLAVKGSVEMALPAQEGLYDIHHRETTNPK